jgi:glucoamylase
MNAVTAYADSFVAITQKYLPSNGSIGEQFDRDTGLPLSAIDLTWSFASFVTMAQRRNGQYPASWNARNVGSPYTCAGSSTPGVYVPAIAAGAPNVTSFCTVPVLFEVNATTYYGENIYLYGNVSDLGAWDVDNAFAMSAYNYTSSRPLWYAQVYLPAGQTVSYSYIRQENCNQPFIFETVNRTVSVPACGSAGINTDDAWAGPVGYAKSC